MSPEFGNNHHRFSPLGAFHSPSYRLQLHSIPNQRENVLNTHIWLVCFTVLLCHRDMIHLYVIATLLNFCSCHVLLVWIGNPSFCLYIFLSLSSFCHWPETLLIQAVNTPYLPQVFVKLPSSLTIFPDVQFWFAVKGLLVFHHVLAHSL